MAGSLFPSPQREDQRLADVLGFLQGIGDAGEKAVCLDRRGASSRRLPRIVLAPAELAVLVQSRAVNARSAFVMSESRAVRLTVDAEKTDFATDSVLALDG